MKKLLSFAILFLSLAIVWNWFDAPAARSFQTTEAKPQKWEYLAESVEAASLQAKLTEWSNANWEFVTMALADSVVDSNDNDKPRLRVEKYQVIARRPVK